MKEPALVLAVVLLLALAGGLLGLSLSELGSPWTGPRAARALSLFLLASFLVALAVTLVASASSR